MQKIIKDSEMVPVQLNNLVLDSTVTPGSYNAPTSDAVATAIAEGGSSYSAGDGIAITNDVISARVDGNTVEINDGKLAVKSRPRYTTRTETVTMFQTANINEGESVLYKATYTKNHVTIFCAEGCTDAQVIISAATAAQVLQLDTADVKVGNKNIPVVDLRPRAYDIRPSSQYSVLISTHEDGSGYGPPESFDDFAFADPPVLDESTYLEYETESYSKNIIIMIRGQAAFIYAE